MLARGRRRGVYAPEKKLPYAINRYCLRGAAPLPRHPRCAARQAKDNAGRHYTIVDMNVWGWARMMRNILGEGRLGQVPNLKRMATRSAQACGAEGSALRTGTSSAEMDGRRRRRRCSAIYPKRSRSATRCFKLTGADGQPHRAGFVMPGPLPMIVQ